MKKISFLIIIFLSLVFSNCSCNSGNQTKYEHSTVEDLDDDIIPDYIPSMLNQIERAVQNKNFELAHEVLRSIPPKFDELGRIFYKNESGFTKEFSYYQYVKKSSSSIKVRIRSIAYKK